MNEQLKGEKRIKDRNALAGRVRFSMGKLESGELEAKAKEIALKILASPKPPSPAFYFRHSGDTTDAITKKDLSLDKHQPQGRKQYLHQMMQVIKDNKYQWETAKENEEKDKNQKSKVTPIAVGSTFSFSVRFDNLTDDELNLLCFALKPSSTFWHKLGMGKALGLGSVEIKPEKINLINRKAYYEECPFDIMEKKPHDNIG